jgi:uncharacterized protein (TIGR02996 family)
MNDDAFCRAIADAPEDTTRRLVYADWLEEQGDPRAEFLRADLRLAAMPTDDLDRPHLQEQLQDMRRDLDPAWLARLDRTPIENCDPAPPPPPRWSRLWSLSGASAKDVLLEFTYDCPRRWELLSEGDDPSVRHCAACARSVYHCATLEEAREHAWQGHCVAVDSRLARTPGDLDPPELMTMGILAPPERAGDNEEFLLE